MKLQGAEDQYIEQFACTGFTRYEIWTDFQDFLTNFTYFHKTQCAGGKFKVLTLCRVNDMASKI